MSTVTSTLSKLCWRPTDPKPSRFCPRLPMKILGLTSTQRNATRADVARGRLNENERCCGG